MGKRYELTPTQRFRKDLKNLPKHIIQKAAVTLDQLCENPKYPGLRSKRNFRWSRFMGFQVYECSINMNYRIIYSIEDDTIILLHAIGNHDIVEK